MKSDRCKYQIIPNNTDLKLIIFWHSDGKYSVDEHPILGFSIDMTNSVDELELTTTPITVQDLYGDWAYLYSNGRVIEPDNAEYHTLQMFIDDKAIKYDVVPHEDPVVPR